MRRRSRTKESVSTSTILSSIPTCRPFSLFGQRKPKQAPCKGVISKARAADVHNRWDGLPSSSACWLVSLSAWALAQHCHFPS
jgi:hypothetical protein